MERLLDEVIRDGAPAQREQARALREHLARDPSDARVRESALHLIDAFRHDPYLWR